MCMKSTFPLSWVYIYGDIYTIQAVLIKDNHWVFLKRKVTSLSPFSLSHLQQGWLQFPPA